MLDLNSIEIGSVVKLPVTPTYLEFDGVVDYIHPERRFFRVKFDLPSGKTLHESYPFCGPLIEKNRGDGSEYFV